MVDTISAKRRSWNMSRIRSGNTKPEMQLRSLLHKAGFRFRLHAKSLPGTPDIVMKKHRAVVMVQGCFWHRHSGCRNSTMPSTRPEFWEAKFADTVARDKRNHDALTALGWRVITVWECQLEKNAQRVVTDVYRQLRGRA